MPTLSSLLERMDWSHHWNDSTQVHNINPFVQVGKTVQGVPISSRQLQLIAECIKSALNLGKEDLVADLCCGNGLLTTRLVSACQAIIGIDFSEPLITSAILGSKDLDPKRIRYVIADVCNLPNIYALLGFNKIYMYEALQHFGIEEAIKALSQFCKGDILPSIFLGSIPDKSRLMCFYNTAERLNEYHQRQRDGTEPIGHWWSQDEIAYIAKKIGYISRVIQQPSDLHTSHYRFDILLTPMERA